MIDELVEENRFRCQFAVPHAYNKDLLKLLLEKAVSPDVQDLLSTRLRIVPVS